jgi:hypothetical protein
MLQNMRQNTTRAIRESKVRMERTTKLIEQSNAKLRRWDYNTWQYVHQPIFSNDRVLTAGPLKSGLSLGPSTSSGFRRASQTRNRLDLNWKLS